LRVRDEDWQALPRTKYTRKFLESGTSLAGAMIDVLQLAVLVESKLPKCEWIVDILRGTDSAVAALQAIKEGEDDRESTALLSESFAAAEIS
jgi:hypothetical protein